MRNKTLDLIIVGAQKAGTTSLNNYLRSHPNISGHSATEFSFFVNSVEYEQGFDKVYDKYFESKNDSKIVAKNVTISSSENSLPRLKDHNPDIKIIFLLREPTARTYSSYTMAVKDGWMQRPFSDLIRIIEKKDHNDIMYRHFVKPGHYSEQINTLMKYFPSENIRLYLFEDLKNYTQEVCNDIFNWLGLPEFKIEYQIHNPTFQPKSNRIRNILSRFKSEENPLKKLFKAILPYSLFHSISRQVTKLNESNKKFESIDPLAKKRLDVHFEDFNKDLGNTIDQLGKENLRVFGEKKWL